MRFTRRDYPPKHPITSSICWRWEFEWEAKAFTSPYRVCGRKLASRADLFQYLFANYLGSDDGDDHLEQEFRQDLKNWSLVCFDWAHLCRRRLFAGGAYLHNREDLAAFMVFSQSTSDVPRIINYLRKLYLPQDICDDSSCIYPMSQLELRPGNGWLQIIPYSIIPFTSAKDQHSALSTAASLPVELLPFILRFINTHDNGRLMEQRKGLSRDLRSCSLVSIDWAVRSRLRLFQQVNVHLRTREDIEALLQFTKEQSRIPRLTEIIHKLDIWQDPTSPSWIHLPCLLKSDRAIIFQPSHPQQDNSVCVKLHIHGGGSRDALFKTLHESFMRFLPSSLSGSPYTELRIDRVSLRTISELGKIARGAHRLCSIEFNYMSWNFVKDPAFLSNMCAMIPIHGFVNQPLKVIARASTNDVLASLFTYFTVLATRCSGRKNPGIKSVPVEGTDQGILRTLLAEILRDQDCVELCQYHGCTFSSLFRAHQYPNHDPIEFLAMHPDNGQRFVQICAVLFQQTSSFRDAKSRTEQIARWATALPSIRKFPALRTVIFYTPERSKLPELFKDVVDAAGSPPAAITYRYTHGVSSSNQIFEVTRDGLHIPGRKWASLRDMLKEMIG